MIDEKEIERIILKKMPEDLRGEVRALQLIGARQAAHAIAERLKEGMVWEGMATVERKFDESASPSEVSYKETLRFDPIRPAWLSSVKDGQRVRVQVLKEPE